MLFLFPEECHQMNEYQSFALEIILIEKEMIFIYKDDESFPWK